MKRILPSKCAGFDQLGMGSDRRVFMGTEKRRLKVPAFSVSKVISPNMHSYDIRPGRSPGQSLFQRS